MAAIELRSTRTDHQRIPFLDALEKGLADDGGLFIPSAWPEIDWDSLSRDSFSACSLDFLKQWLGDSIPASDIEGIVSEALSFDVPIVDLAGKDAYQNIHVLELFHGPTLSFKDFGARTMAYLLGRKIQQSGGRATILVATSGDTGSAVADGFAGVEGVNVVLLFPEGGVSPVQEMQLIARRENVFPLRVRGTFDDCQRMVKGAFADPALSGSHLTTANSINIGRLLPQMLYYVWATKFLDSDQVTFSVPSGNLGNLTAGVFAHLSGLPVRQFLAAHNANDFFPNYLQDPTSAFKPSVSTVSNAMDVGAPSNFERLQGMLSYSEISKNIWGTTVSDEETMLRMSAVSDCTGYIADPHTAVGIEAILRFRKEMGGRDKDPTVVLSTAHPAKFPETIQKVLGTTAEEPERLSSLRSGATRVQEIEPTQEALRQVVLACEG
ncbi:MAG: threonine synthase [Bacteroidetes Order II. Incertae sedis bacterium]|jgi:threonine synthase|nr:threonine synthase [Bacteroidetes Order II. bacterium]MBT4601717.1 threonine synthase [Bacteroidetes Order II. bacterium]MBT5250590.1 threonine synthase [Bacteroidetes Order II. bacterium]MBT6201268.1 threonine synthase [Bacteroidetes Order II. bacterium]MBT6425837.1 threonine synthase [Bacteroidetes Order II. bacterium]